MSKPVCGICGCSRPGMDGPDPCLGMLPGVKNACCGHGESMGYVAFENGTVINFKTIVVNGQMGQVLHEHESGKVGIL